MSSPPQPQGVARCTCVVGLQWGDEAKGKIVDLLTDQHDFVVRFNGGVRVGELLYPDHLRERLQRIVPRKNALLRALSAEARAFDAEALWQQYRDFGERLRPHVADTTRLLQRALAEGRRVLFEAAQG